MTDFSDVGRLVEQGTLAQVFEQLPAQVALSEALAKVGGPHNTDASNQDPNAPRADGKKLLLCDVTPISEGVLGP